MAALLLAAGCGPTLQVKTDYDHRADFGKYRTFTMQQGKVISELGYGEERNTLVTQRIDQALRDQLRAKGLQPTADQPDLVVSYVAGARTRRELEGMGYTGLGWWGPAYDDFWVREYPEGTLVIDFRDARTDQLVWRAYVRAEGEGINDAKFIQKSVARALQSYPPRTA
jgi:hypothetical protein